MTWASGTEKEGVLWNSRMNQFTGVSSTLLESDGTPKICALSSCEPLPPLPSCSRPLTDGIRSSSTLEIRRSARRQRCSDRGQEARGRSLEPHPFRHCSRGVLSLRLAPVATREIESRNDAKGYAASTNHPSGVGSTKCKSLRNRIFLPTDLILER
jgi:hypothetical protein